MVPSKTRGQSFHFPFQLKLIKEDTEETASCTLHMYTSNETALQETFEKKN